MTIMPFGDRITITDPPAEPQRKDKLVIPEGAEVDMKSGIVLEVGIEVEGLNKGDKVWYACHHPHTRIKDTTFIHEACVVAYERD